MGVRTIGVVAILNGMDLFSWLGAIPSLSRANLRWERRRGSFLKPIGISVYRLAMVNSEKLVDLVNIEGSLPP